MLTTRLDMTPKESEQLNATLKELEAVDSFGIVVELNAKQRFLRATSQFFQQCGFFTAYDRAHDEITIDSNPNSRFTGSVAIVPALSEDAVAIAFMDKNEATMIISIAKDLWNVEFINIHKHPEGPHARPLYFCMGYTAISRLMAQGFHPSLLVRCEWSPKDHKLVIPYRVVLGKDINVESL